MGNAQSRRRSRTRGYQARFVGTLASHSEGTRCPACSRRNLIGSHHCIVFQSQFGFQMSIDCAHTHREANRAATPLLVTPAVTDLCAPRRWSRVDRPPSPNPPQLPCARPLRRLVQGPGGPRHTPEVNPAFYSYQDQTALSSELARDDAIFRATPAMFSQDSNDPARK